MDHMAMFMRLRYASRVVEVPRKAKVNIKPVKIDFPLPEKLIGSQNRLNTPLTYSIPDFGSSKASPQALVGGVCRLSHLIENYEQYVDKNVTVAGWVRQARLQAKDTLLFAQLTDGSTQKTFQVVITDKVPNWNAILKVKTGYSLRVQGKVVKSPGKGQKVEMLVSGAQKEFVTIHGVCDDPEYPLNSKNISLETLRDHAHLRARTQTLGAVQRVKNNVAFATHLFFQNNGFLYVHTPLITSADCEGAGQMFQVTTILPNSDASKEIPTVDGKINYSQDFFKKKANLTVSGQLAVENICCALGNVYTFGPTFRAQVSHTSRHVAEFWMIEPQLAFADVFDTMECAEAYIQFCIKFVLKHNRADLEFLEEKKKGLVAYLEKLIEAPFGRASYTEAIDILLKVIERGVVFQNEVKWGIDLNSEHERYLSQHVFKKLVIIYNYPKEIKSFYMRENPDGKTVASFDILAPEVGEIVGGSQREEREDKLQSRIESLGMDVKDYWWYMDLRRYGTVPHGGFGLGFERLVMICTGMENIRDVCTFPRTPGNCEF